LPSGLRKNPRSESDVGQLGDGVVEQQQGQFAVETRLTEAGDEQRGHAPAKVLAHQPARRVYQKKKHDRRPRKTR